ncbi:zinc-finger homeodomain protein 11-like [Cynara cardunculus var. scolymus]|uniref:zinc-finger homeodomain protein 11-like n=1 Tax=Cynara cardunculus var. scolymus TaxID=59895 RepID=UPI000D625D55|nr:zinc-finger homeodomain protein 11-like [Cynara cardunculus var. scolymus]
MDLKHITTNTSGAGADTPDSETETLLHSQLGNPLSSFSNGKKHHRQPPPTVVAYKECLKNHAATIGSHAVDGCGEFMPSPVSEPISLKCAACGCHRNFHRRDPIDDNYAYAPHVLLSLSTAADQNHTVAIPGTPAAIKIENPNGRKRFRTKFSQDQKEKMSLFAEKVGWKMQRCDDKLVAEFCNELGIRRGIFKVWMHNNKNTFGKKEKDITSPTTTATAAAITTSTATVGISSKSINIFNNGRPVICSDFHEENNNVDRRDNSNSSDQENVGGGGGGGDCGRAVHLQASTNGSSSSC